VTERKIDGRTKRAANMALAKKQISQVSYEAILAGTLTLAEARKIEREGPHDTGQASGGHEEGRKTLREGRTPRHCMCSCGGTTKGGRFLPGHDTKLRSELVAQIKKGDVLLRSERITPEQRRYAVERGLVGPEVLPEEERNG
jgi:hypothetical protein